MNLGPNTEKLNFEPRFVYQNGTTNLHKPSKNPLLRTHKLGSAHSNGLQSEEKFQKTVDFSTLVIATFFPFLAYFFLPSCFLHDMYKDMYLIVKNKAKSKKLMLLNVEIVHMSLKKPGENKTKYFTLN